jgi:hypothetical protein
LHSTSVPVCCLVTDPAYTPPCPSLLTPNCGHPSPAHLDRDAEAATDSKPCVVPSPGDPPIPGLLVYQGHGCPHYSYIARTNETIQKHHCETYEDLEPPCGRGQQSQWQAKASRRLTNYTVSCQRLFPNKHGS